MTAEKSAAFATLRDLARPFRFRVVADAEGFPIIKVSASARHAGSRPLPRPIRP